MSLWRLEAFSVSVGLKMLNREKEGLANAEVEVVSSEIPTADIAIRWFNFMEVTSRLTCGRNLGENINSYGSQP
jgi:hypothetical protein